MFVLLKTKSPNMKKITPFLWFNNNLEEAIQFYISVFRNAKVKDIMRAGKGGPAPEGSIFTATFELEGQEFMGLNGGPHFQFNESVSFFVRCHDQAEVDYFWDKLSEGGTKSRCGWLKDRFGLSWQVVPENLGEFLWSGEPAKNQRAMQAMMGMDKLDIAALRKAYEGA